MSRIRIATLSLFAVFAVSAVGATGAQAIKGPYYKVEKARLAAFRGRDIVKAKAGVAGFLLKSTTGVEIHCKELEVTGQVIGSNSTNGSGSKETITFKECRQEHNGEPCEVEAETVKTLPLSNRLAYSSNVPANGQKLFVVFEPEEGTKFAEIKFKGAGCIAKALAVEPTNNPGGVCGEVWGGGAPVTIGTEVERKVGEVNFPSPAIANAWVEDSGALTVVKCGLDLGGIAATLTGRALFELKNVTEWGVFTT